MKVLLRDDLTGLYYGKQGAWVGDTGAAASFETLAAAGQRAKEFDREEVNVVLSYDNPPCELALNPAYCIQPIQAGRLAVSTIPAH